MTSPWVEQQTLRQLFDNEHLLLYILPDSKPFLIGKARGLVLDSKSMGPVPDSQTLRKLFCSVNKFELTNWVNHMIW